MVSDIRLAPPPPWTPAGPPARPSGSANLSRPLIGGFLVRAGRDTRINPALLQAGLRAQSRSPAPPGAAGAASPRPVTKLEKTGAGLK